MVGVAANAFVEMTVGDFAASLDLTLGTSTPEGPQAPAPSAVKSALRDLAAQVVQSLK
jgi:hypothetical protein